MAVYFVVMSILNNLAFSFNISQPMHMVFRSSNLMVSYVYGYVYGRKRYTAQQLLAVVLLTLGALCATWAEMRMGDTADAAAKPCANCGDVGAAAAAAAGGGGGGAGWLSALSNSEATGALYLLRWWMGIGILVLVLVLQTRLGALQEACKDTYGEAPFEMLFYFHFFSLPAFFFCVPSLPGVFARWTASHSTALELQRNWGVSAAALAAAQAGPLGLLARAALSLPIMWMHVALNCATQFVCLTGVYTLIGQADQLTVNVALTVRKFLSLMLSIWVFGNKFTGAHWLGAVLVIGGSTYFSLAPKPPKAPAGAAGAAGGAAPAGDAQQQPGAGGGAGAEQLLSDSQDSGARSRAALLKQQ
jgi:UDP-xylose/UDP-N-acetylglucosamine transporter B4